LLKGKCLAIIFIRNLVKAEKYAYRHAYGQNRSDSDDDDYTEELRAKLVLMTPNTRRNYKSIIEEEQTGKVGPAGTFFTLLKGFVASGVLFLPKGFVTGGWLFSSVTLFLSCILTIV
jgi:solute carrier family 36 (proton-coupled amino acid transporter)